MLKVKGKRLYREDGSLFAEIDGWRPKNSRRGAESYRNSGYTIHYVRDPADRLIDDLVGGYCYFADAVRDARNRYRQTQDQPST